MMVKYLNYFRLVIHHKWYVLRAGIMLDIPIKQLLLHDLSKFCLYEFIPMARALNIKNRVVRLNISASFLITLNHHHTINKHHWEYWCQHGGKPMLIPENYAREMIADWVGAGRAICGTWDFDNWHLENSKVIRLHPDTKLYVNEQIALLKLKISKRKRNE